MKMFLSSYFISIIFNGMNKLGLSPFKLRLQTMDGLVEVITMLFQLLDVAVVEAGAELDKKDKLNDVKKENF